VFFRTHTYIWRVRWLSPIHIFSKIISILLKWKFYHIGGLKVFHHYLVILYNLWKFEYML
jgi:hypothetical protein